MLRWQSLYIHYRSQLSPYMAIYLWRLWLLWVSPRVQILAPYQLFFFINDIKKCFKHCMVLLYANDLEIFGKIISIQDCYKFWRILKNFWSTAAKTNLSSTTTNITIRIRIRIRIIGSIVSTIQRKIQQSGKTRLEILVYYSIPN